MRALPTGYRTATADGKVIAVYCGGQKVGEATAKPGATHQDLIALEDEAVALAEEHATAAAAVPVKAAKPSTSGDAGTAPRTPRSGGGRKRRKPSTSGDAGTE